MIGACSDLRLDISSSTGAGAYPWRSYHFQVFDSVLPQADNLEDFLNGDSYQLNPASIIPAREIKKGRKYIFQLTLCNFLLKCGTSRHTVFVDTISKNDQSISLAGVVFGSLSRLVYADNTLQLQAQGYLSVCNSSQSLSTSMGLTYQWGVYTFNGTLLGALRSISSNDRQLRLAPYSLSAGSSYSVVLSVSSMALPSIKANTSVNIDVLYRSLDVKFVGSRERTLVVGQTAVLDASLSSDPNRNNAVGVSAGLSFSWSCIQISPVVDTTICPLNFAQRNWAVGSKFDHLDASSTVKFANTTARVKVVATYNNLMNSSYVDVAILLNASLARAASVEVVLLKGSSTHFDVREKFTLAGRLIGQNMSCLSRWSVNDPLLALSNNSLTPLRVSQTLSMNSVPVYSLVYLSLSPNSLATSSTYLFKFACDNLTASISIATNGAPQAGLFAVKPLQGKELND
eukprot:scaffold286_cov342-Ochromonas_danica.AAC.1